MKVLIVHPHMSFYGGAETVVINLAREIKKLDVENSVLTLSISEEVKSLCEGVEVITPEECFGVNLQNRSFAGSMKRLFAEVMALRRLVMRYAAGYDIINTHNFPATWALAFTGHKNIVWMCNEPPDMWNKEGSSILLKVIREVGYHIDRFIVRRTVQRLCVADELNGERIGGRYGMDFDIISYGIEYDLFSEGDGSVVIEKYGLQDKFIVTQVGTITPQKNQMESVTAVKELKNKIPNIILLLAGTGSNDYEKSIRGYIRENKMNEHIFFLGHLPKNEIAAIYCASNVALFPVKTQGGWLAPFEAMCASVPVIVSGTMGAASLIKREGLGIVTQNYADAVFDIYRNPSAYREKTIVSKEWVKNNLTWANFAKRNLQIFEDIIKNKGGNE
ncbi:MAG: glycosyltransferase family 4 protein [Deltaproteobacteria bacterium]|nr:glycosyltransferase family 4 protein [Deltaproteobacteria bacterium]